MEDCERSSLSVLLGQPSIVYINNGEIKIIAHNPELGGDTLYNPLHQLKPEKSVHNRGFCHNRGFWIIKYTEVEIKMILGTDRGWQSEYTLLVSEADVDYFINWHKAALRL